MNKRMMLALCLCTGALWAAHPAVEEKEAIQRIFPLSHPSAPRRVTVDNLHGSIRVAGYPGHEVRLEVQQTIRAESPEKVAQARQDVRLDISQEDNSLRLYVDGPFRTPNGSINNRGWDYYGYQVNFDFQLQVPTDTELTLKNVNDGGIRVENVAGNYDVHNINGRIEMLEVSGSGRAYALNGQLKVLFRKNPESASYFGSLNGNIDLFFQPDLSADLQLKTFNGQIFSDFPFTARPIANPPPERRNGKFVYRSNRFSGVRVGQGGPEIKLDGFNGNIHIRQRDR